jgi:hypothetical protein
MKYIAIAAVAAVCLILLGGRKDIQRYVRIRRM